MTCDLISKCCVIRMRRYRRIHRISINTQTAVTQCRTVLRLFRGTILDDFRFEKPTQIDRTSGTVTYRSSARFCRFFDLCASRIQIPGRPHVHYVCPCSKRTKHRKELTKCVQNRPEVVESAFSNEVIAGRSAQIYATLMSEANGKRS